MSRRAVALALLLASTALGADRDVRTLLARRARVAAPAEKLARLRLPPSVLAASQPDLADLRLVDADGVAVPFVIASAEDPFGAHAKTLVFRDLRVANVERAEERRDDGPTFWRERYDLDVDGDDDPRDAAWELVLITARPTYVRHVDVDVLEGRETGERLATRAPVFALLGSSREPAGLATERVTVPLAGVAPRLRVTISGEGDGWLEPAFRLRATRPVPDVARARMPLDVLERRDGETTTTLDLAVPGALVPDRLSVATSTGALSRYVTVATAVAGSETAATHVGRGIVARARPGDPLDPAEVQLRLDDGRRLAPGVQTLRVSIENGDSPPLADLAITALVPVPELLFVAPAAPVHLHFGGSRVQAARYDVTALAETWRAAGDDALVDASVGAVEPNPLYDPTPLLDIAMQPAKTLDRRLFSHARALTVPPTTDGLAQVELDVDDLVVARPDLADVRIVDDENRQWPYLVADTSGYRWVTRPLEPLAPAEGWSRHRLRVAHGPVPIDRIEVASPAPVVDREARVLASDAADAHVLAQGAIGRTPFDAGLAGARHDALVVVVRDGDERPLPLAEARLRVVVPRLNVVAPAGAYTLLVGNADAEAPEYSLASIRSLVHEARGEPADVGPLGPNPTYSAGAGLLSGAWLGRRGPGLAVWIVLIAGGLVLVLLTLRAVRREPHSD